MKKLFLSLTLVAFVGATAVSANSVITEKERTTKSDDKKSKDKSKKGDKKASCCKKEGEAGKGSCCKKGGEHKAEQPK